MDNAKSVDAIALKLVHTVSLGLFIVGMVILHNNTVALASLAPILIGLIFRELYVSRDDIPSNASLSLLQRVVSTISMLIGVSTVGLHGGNYTYPPYMIVAVMLAYAGFLWLVWWSRPSNTQVLITNK